jgi:superfamily I DNA and/or RNA helicase
MGVRQHIKMEETESRVTFLDTQYRMVPPIADVVSQLAYGGRLVADLQRAIA